MDAIIQLTIAAMAEIILRSITRNRFNFTSNYKEAIPHKIIMKRQAQHIFYLDFCSEIFLNKEFLLPQDMKDIRKDYDLYLDNLMDECNTSEWAYVKMIDFAHVFPAEAASIDTNYLFGIENLVKILEEFLRECDQ